MIDTGRVPPCVPDAPVPVGGVPAPARPIAKLKLAPPALLDAVSSDFLTVFQVFAVLWIFVAA